MGTRDFIKILNKHKTVIEWTGQKRISRQWQNHIDSPHLYNWRALWSAFKSKNSTSMKNSKLRSFWFKLMHDELPTLDKLATRKPSIYEGITTCCLCGKVKETREHLLSCPMLDEQNNRAWEAAIKKFKNDINKKMTKPEGKEREKEVNNGSKAKIQGANNVSRFLSDFEDRTFGSQKKLLDIVLGLICENDISKLGKAMGNTRGSVTKARSLLIKFSYRLRKYFREFTWKTRCKIINEMEKTRGIKKKDKKNQKKKKKRMESSGSKGNLEQDNQETRGKAPEITGKTQEIVFDWIMGGVNWLGV